MLTPVTLPPGRLRLVTRPARSGSAELRKTIGIVEVAAIAAFAGGAAPVRQNYRDLAVDQFGSKAWQPVGLSVRPPILYVHIPPFDETGFLETREKTRDQGRPRLS